MTILSTNHQPINNIHHIDFLKLFLAATFTAIQLARSFQKVYYDDDQISIHMTSPSSNHQHQSLDTWDVLQLRSYARAFVRSLVRQLPIFLGNRSVDFSEIWHEGSLIWFLKSDGACFFKKKLFTLDELKKFETKSKRKSKNNFFPKFFQHFFPSKIFFFCSKKFYPLKIFFLMIRDRQKSRAYSVD